MEKPWGRVEAVKGEASVDVLVIEPGKEVPAHSHGKTLEVHVFLSGKEKGRVDITRPGERHSYRNDSGEELRLLCLCVPPYDAEDVVE